MADPHSDRRILAAEVLSVGSEITTGGTRDTNAPELATDLTERGVRVVAIHAFPDDLATVREAFAAAMARTDIVVSTGGLGPTPDDLTREAIAWAVGEEPRVDIELEGWLRGLWARRRLPFPEINLKQAWLIPSAEAIPNVNGTAPGWWVEGPGGGLVVALPGPPREMRPMWRDWVLPRLAERGVGQPHAVRTLRLYGIGESQVADRLGEEFLRGANPVVATYARADAVDVRITAVDDATASAESHADEAEGAVRSILAEHIWGTGGETWADAVGSALGRFGWTLAAHEIGTAGNVGALLGDVEALVRATLSREASPGDEADAVLSRLADELRGVTGADVGLAVRAEPAGDDTGVSVAIVTPHGGHEERRIAFQGGDVGRGRAALTAAWILVRHLRSLEPASAVSASRRP